MNKSCSLTVLAAAMISIFLVVGPAEAANWKVAPAGGGFKASASTGVTLKVQNKTTSCTTPTASGTLTGAGGGIATGPVFTSPWNAFATVTPAFTGCTNAGINYTVRCGVANMNAVANGYNGGVATTEAGSAGLSTNVLLSAILCTIKPTATPSNNCSTVTGTVPTTYTNPVAAALQGFWNWLTGGQSVTTASVGGCISSIGTGSSTFSALNFPVIPCDATCVAPPKIWAQ